MSVAVNPKVFLERFRAVALFAARRARCRFLRR